MRRVRPRQLGGAFRDLRNRTAPATLLAAVQEAWPAAAGPRVAAVAHPVSEREGVITVACDSATWAHELDLLQADLVRTLNEALAGRTEQIAAGRVSRLRLTADASRFNA